MFVGILFILAGILIAIYPPLLSIIVAVFLMSVGAMFVSMHYYYKKISRDVDNPFVNFIIRF